MIRPLLLLLCTAVAVAALAFLQSTTPSYTLLTGPVETDGVQKDTVSSRTFAIKVKKVIRAETISFTRYGQPTERQTGGCWLIVSVELQSKRETMSIRGAAIEGASGRLYRQSLRVDGAPRLVSDKRIQPGLTTRGLFVFELPEPETQDMTLVVSRQPSPRLESEIRVKLDRNGVEKRGHVEIGGNDI
ncbi:MAG: hypothetical protein J0H18_00715 [Rhizobiales bacterium]|nr:hypothetical protein [Hyphomicrobiales bacterium]OJY07420.1 MAG: hypothetical protein BGP07_05905 [Rhizobiales bacterium 63-22]